MRSSSKLFLLGSIMGGLLFASPALATPVWTSVDLNLRTGPGEEFPVLGVMRKNDEAEALGCLADWTWCDVSIDGFHGWAAAEFLVTKKHHLFSNPGESVGELKESSLIGIVEPVVIELP